jgi:asparagine synthase (glutamine-hydrolysing)
METFSPPHRPLQKALDRALEDALAPLRATNAPLGVLFSGGVDSALIAWELRKQPRVVLCTLGREGSADLTSGRAGAARLGLPWQMLSVSSTGLRDAGSRFEQDLKGVSPVSRAVLLSLAIAIEQAEPQRLVCGQGADELFLGYAHYRNLSGPDAERRSHDDLDRLHDQDWPRTQRIAEKAGKTIVAPYLSTRFEEVARRVPVELRLPGNRPKGFFRDWAQQRGLPIELAERPKKALQYGTGVSGLLRKADRPGG